MKILCQVSSSQPVYTVYTMRIEKEDEEQMQQQLHGEEIVHVAYFTKYCIDITILFCWTLFENRKGRRAKIFFSFTDRMRYSDIQGEKNMVIPIKL